MKTKSILALCLMLCLMACAGNSFIKNAADTAAVSKTADDVALTALGNLYKQGLTSEAVKVQAIKYGNIYKVAHNSMVEALAIYAEAQTAPNQQTYLAAANLAAKTLADLLTYCQPFIVKGGN